MNYKKNLMINSSFIKRIIFVLSIISIVSCDMDYNTIGSDIIDDDAHYGMTKLEVPLTAYDRKTGVVQSNNLTLNSLGVYENPVFGTTVASFVTQVQLSLENPGIYDPVIDSVYLYVPYFSTLESTDSETGVSTYELDSIYGTEGQKFRLDIFRNGYFLRDSDLGQTTPTGQKYFSNDIALVNGATVGGRLNNFSPEQSDEFAVTPTEIARTAIPTGQTASKVVERKAPGIFTYFDKTEFQNLLFGPGATGKLTNNNVFKEYFRGLYFRVQQTTGSVMIMPRFELGTVTIKYQDYDPSTAEDAVDGHTPEKVSKTLTLNLKGNTINFFENTPTTDFASAIASSDNVAGDERLYIKGGDGSMAFVDIDEATIDVLKEENLGSRALINEANIVFYIDDTNTGMGKVVNGKKAIEPLRIYLYDVNNKRPLIDYYIDTSTYPSNKKYDKYIHDGLIQRDRSTTEKRGVKYKIRVTDYINNLINKDSTNVKLGLVVSEYVNQTGYAALKPPFLSEPFTSNGETQLLDISTLPVTSVMHPFGTILYGTGPTVPQDKRLKLEIFYTKPN